MLSVIKLSQTYKHINIMAQIITPTNLGTSFDLGTITPNKVEIKIDNISISKDGSGVLSATPSQLTWDNLTKIVTHTSGTGIVTNIDLFEFTTDIYVNGGSFNPATQVITLVDGDGVTPDITIDLSSLLGVSTDAGNLLINGTDGKALLTKTEIDAISGICTDAFGVPLFRGINL